MIHIQGDSVPKVRKYMGWAGLTSAVGLTVTSHQVTILTKVTVDYVG
jgi:hypothetical protein